MDLSFTPEQERFRKEVRSYLDDLLHGEFAEIRGRGGPGDEHSCFEERLAWEQRLGADGWTCVGWPTEFGGRGLPLHQQVIYFEEYARAGGPGRLGHIGEGLIGPTLIHFGTPEQQRRFLPPIRLGQELWCQGYSEPNAGSDLANIQTRAELDGDRWVINGQKVWTSLATWAHWCFVLARTDRDAPKHKGISFLLVPMDAPGIEIRPIVQITGSSEFNEVFFSDTPTPADLVVGGMNNGWKVAMGLLAFERGASTLGQQFAFMREYREVLEACRRNGRAGDPVVRQRLAQMWSRLEIMRLNTLRMLTMADRPELSGPAYISKLYWARLHRDLGELAVDVLGPEAMIAAGTPFEPTAAQRLFLYSRADTIYGGANQIQRNIIGERALGLPPEPKVIG
ncbi:acyl-CoA dehydrogenase family protein [Rhabdothermincola sp.]|uniref:acyl-CoA dehydrogenase family protein n=1 Tax=Rhabdothermincola sp. TaxID=2820405 RepID=UPI002FE1B0B8